MRRVTLRVQLALWFALAVAMSLLLFSVGVLTVLSLDEQSEAAQSAPPAPSDDTADDVDRVLWAMLIVAPIGVCGSAAFGYFIAGRALAPLRDAGLRARAARASDLDLRLPTTGRNDEWDSLANTMNELLAAARASMQRIRAFTADAAHELRTPLTTIIGEADVTLRRERSPEQLRAALELTRSEAARLADIVTGLLTLARADEGHLLQARGEVDLRAIAEDVLRRWEPIAQKEGRALRVTGPGAKARGDAGLIERVVENLVSNAVLHGGGAIEVFVSPGTGGVAEVHVRDEGDGIPDALADTVFGRFVRGSDSRTGGGSGLGLSLASEIARAHGGSIVLASRRAPTCFVLTLPAQPAVDARAPN